MSPLARQLRSNAAQLHALAENLEAQADAVEAQVTTSNEALDLKQLAERFGFSRESLARATDNGLKVHRGPRGRVMAFEADVLAWIRERDWKPVRKARSPVESQDESDARNAALLASLEAAQ